MTTKKGTANFPFFPLQFPSPNLNNSVFAPLHLFFTPFSTHFHFLFPQFLPSFSPLIPTSFSPFLPLFKPHFKLFPPYFPCVPPILMVQPLISPQKLPEITLSEKPLEPLRLKFPKNFTKLSHGFGHGFHSPQSRD